MEREVLITKRNGQRQLLQTEKITARIFRLCYGLDLKPIDAGAIASKAVAGIYQGATTVELDILAAETAAYMTVIHPDYTILAARIAVSMLHKTTKKKFSAVISDLYHHVNPETQEPASMISDITYACVMKHANELDSAVVHDRDFDYQYFGFKTLERSYLLKIGNRIVERPQHMLMRVAVGIHCEDLQSAIEMYDLMSRKCFIHASPTLFNAGTKKSQLSSCFLVDMKEDSMEGIYDTVKACAVISKNTGGIGLNVHRVRATGSHIAGTNGKSNGLVPMLRVFNNTARHSNQGGNKRPGAFAVYLEPWHADIFEFLELRKTHGKEEFRARDLFYALWIPDLFMKRVEANLGWTLLCPHECPGLPDVHGNEFEALYTKYEKEGFGRNVKAQTLWRAILEAQIETGTPYMLYKDACNKKSNQKNLGTIRNSNLCAEIIEYSAPDQIAVCTLASIALPTFINRSGSVSTYDFAYLHHVVQVVTRNLNKIIDLNQYPVPEARTSNLRHRPIAVGVQGLADTFLALRMPFDSLQARQLNIQIFETIYHATLTASCALSRELGPYESYQGSPISNGELQYDMWGVKPTVLWNWESLKTDIAQHGVRNSLLVALMPTAATSQILGFNECFEPYTSNIYSRRVLAGEFQVVNQWLLRDLINEDLWSDNMKNRIIAEGGSIQNIPNIPKDLKALYKTCWEISQRTIVEMAADRAPFVDQSQSMNIHIQEPTFGKITSMHFAGWKLGLKTGMYYLRTMAASAPIQFTVDQEQLKIVDTNVARSNKISLKRPTSESSEGSDGFQAQLVTLPTVSTRHIPIVPSTVSSSKWNESTNSLDRSPSTPATCLDGTNGVNKELLGQMHKKLKTKEYSSQAMAEEANEGIYSESMLACSLMEVQTCEMCSA